MRSGAPSQWQPGLSSTDYLFRIHGKAIKMSSMVSSSRAKSQVGSALNAVNVIPDDDKDLDGGPARGIFVGTAGMVSFMTPNGNIVTINSADSQYHPIYVKRVRSTGTDASGIVALY
jgi:hypothetical protein